MEYSFLGESENNKNAQFPYETILSEDSVKTI